MKRLATRVLPATPWHLIYKRLKGKGKERLESKVKKEYYISAFYVYTYQKSMDARGRSWTLMDARLHAA